MCCYIIYLLTYLIQYLFIYSFISFIYYAGRK